MSDSKFKQKFDKLLEEMTELSKKASKSDLDSIKAELVKVEDTHEKLLCHTEEDFDTYMMYKVTEAKGELPYILINHFQLEDDEIEQHYENSKAEQRLFIIPSIISSENRQNCPNVPYTLFFLRDGRLFMLPVDGSAFSDQEYTQEN